MFAAPARPRADEALSSTPMGKARASPRLWPRKAVPPCAAILDVGPVQHREKTLANRGQVREFFDIAEREHNAPPVHDDKSRRVGAVSDEGERLVQPLSGPSVLFQGSAPYVLPLLKAA